MTEQILDHGSLAGHAPKGCGVCWPREASGALGSLYLGSGWQEERSSLRDGQPESMMLKAAV